MTRKHRVVLDLEHETRAAEALRAALSKMPDMDEATIADMVEGETNLHETIAKVMTLLSETEIMIVGLDDKLGGYNARKQRYVERKNYLRAMIEQAMVVGEIDGLELPDATLSLSHRKGGVVVVDETKIPSAFWRKPDPEVDKSKIAEALKEGVEVPGATLGNGTVTLTVRRS